MPLRNILLSYYLIKIGVYYHGGVYYNVRKKRDANLKWPMPILWLIVYGQYAAMNKKYMPILGTVAARNFGKNQQQQKHVQINAMLRFGFFRKMHSVTAPITLTPGFLWH